jgi:hypothetical protein
MTMPAAMINEGEPRKRPKPRYLRVAFSAMCGVLSLLLIVMWARSFYARDTTRGCIGGSRLHMYATSLKGEVSLSFDEWRGNPHPWIFDSLSNHENMIAVLPSVTGSPPLSWLGFRWHFKTNLVAVIFPYWFVVLLPAAFAAIPWIPWHFSLRTLLIAMTLIAALLGIIAISN